jgi:hypothetical protein
MTKKKKKRNRNRPNIFEDDVSVVKQVVASDTKQVVASDTKQVVVIKKEVFVIKKEVIVVKKPHITRGAGRMPSTGGPWVWCNLIGEFVDPLNPKWSYAHLKKAKADKIFNDAMRKIEEKMAQLKKTHHIATIAWGEHEKKQASAEQYNKFIAECLD